MIKGYWAYRAYWPYRANRANKPNWANSPYRAYRAYKPYKANRPSKPNNQLFLPQILYPRKGATLIKIVKVVHVLVSLTLKG